MKYASSIACVLCLACGSSPSPTTTEPQAPLTTTPAPAADAPAEVGEGTPWAQKSQAQKIAVMKNEVVPAVAAIWKDSPEPGEEVTCRLCHGEAATTGVFTMPNPELPVLDPADGFAAHVHDQAWLDFMATKLTPTMVETLGVAPYDMQTQTGFGCFSCHTAASAAP